MFPQFCLAEKAAVELLFASEINAVVEQNPAKGFHWTSFAAQNRAQVFDGPLRFEPNLGKNVVQFQDFKFRLSK